METAFAAFTCYKLLRVTLFMAMVQTECSGLRKLNNFNIHVAICVHGTHVFKVVWCLILLPISTQCLHIVHSVNSCNCLEVVDLIKMSCL